MWLFETELELGEAEAAGVATLVGVPGEIGCVALSGTDADVGTGAGGVDAAAETASVGEGFLTEDVSPVLTLESDERATVDGLAELAGCDTASGGVVLSAVALGATPEKSMSVHAIRAGALRRL